VFRRIDMSRFLLPVAIMVALVAVVLPTCQMIGCDMDAMGAMPFMPNGGAYSDCPGQWVVNSSSTSGIVPSGPNALSFMLVLAILAVGAVLFAPQASQRSVVAYVGDPPPPDEDSFGARFRV
jgi:hypothetical protein